MPAQALALSTTYHASNGAAYEAWLGRWASRLARVFLDFADFPDAGDILDVGCGTGALTFAMAERWPGRRVVGADLAEPFLAHARARRSGEQPTFEIGDACALPYRDGQFVGAAAQLVLMFIPRPEVAIQEIRRVTRPGGRVAAALWDFRGGLVFQRLLWDTAVCHRSRSARHARSPVCLSAGAAGRSAQSVPGRRFEGRRAAVAHHPHGFRKFRGLLAAIPGWAGPGGRLFR